MPHVGSKRAGRQGRWNRHGEACAGLGWVQEGHRPRGAAGSLSLSPSALAQASPARLLERKWWPSPRPCLCGGPGDMGALGPAWHPVSVCAHASPGPHPCCSSPAPDPGLGTHAPRICGCRIRTSLTYPALARPSGDWLSLRVQGVLPAAGEPWCVTAASFGCLPPAEGGIRPEVGPFPSLLRATLFWNLGRPESALDEPGGGHEYFRWSGWSVS